MILIIINIKYENNKHCNNPDPPQHNLIKFENTQIINICIAIS